MALSISPKQADFYVNATAKINIAHGAIRSGKTFIVNLKWLDYIRFGAPGILLMTGRTKASVVKNVLNDIFKIVGEGNYILKEREGLCWIYGRRIEFYGADNIEAEKVIRGRTFAGWYGDEITIHHKTLVEQAIGRCSVPGAQIFWTTNPDHPKHHIKVNYIDNLEMAQSGMVKYWHFLFEDNPILDEEYKALLRMGNGGLFYKRNVLGLWVVAEGLVYEEYKPHRHAMTSSRVLEMMNDLEFKEFIGGTDWGSKAPMVGLLIGVTRDNEYVLMDEFYKKNARTQDLINWYKKMESWVGKKLSLIYCDSAEPDRIDDLKREGLNAVPAKKAIAAGINTVQVAFKNDRLYIDTERCANTDTELQTYKYPDEKEEPKLAKKDLPIDDDNHAMDGLRYAVNNHEVTLYKRSKRAARDTRRSNRKYGYR